MRIVAEFSFNGGRDAVTERYKYLLSEVLDAIHVIDADDHLTKASKEKTMPGRILYSPTTLNTAFKDYLTPRGWTRKRVPSIYSVEYYRRGYEPLTAARGAFREMDFVKEQLGVEVQFGKYAFMVYNVCAKMTIFHNLGFIDTGIEVVPVKGFADHMSTGVSYFEQFVWDLEQRGVANIDIPVLILGIDR
ncbi:MAG: restriction endonuclease [Chloroflexi bacterium]|nr:restriction endonuclease [Chloroflexota bacterium]